MTKQECDDDRKVAKLLETCALLEAVDQLCKIFFSWPRAMPTHRKLLKGHILSDGSGAIFRCLTTHLNNSIHIKFCG